MKLSANNFDLWTFRRTSRIEYLLLKTSQDKADHFFGGGRFWQIPTDVIASNQNIESAATQLLDGLNLSLLSLWAAEYTYTIYNRRCREIAVIPVFAAEVATSESKSVSLTWEHSDSQWFSASECAEHIHFRGLKEGLISVREYITEIESPAAELRLI